MIRRKISIQKPGLKNFRLLLFLSGLLVFCLIPPMCLAKSYKVIVGYENEEIEIPLIPGRVASGQSKMPAPDSPQMNSAFPNSADTPTVVPLPEPEPEPETLIAIEDEVPDMEIGFPEDNGVPTPESLQAALDSTGRVVVGGISFDFDSSNLSNSSLPSLQAMLTYFRNNPGVKIRIEGHCDTSGDTSLNPALSQARADSVRDWLIERGVDSLRLWAVGMSHNYPIADNSTAAGQEKNRRVEMVKVN
ncbi:MAG: hypothetical protein CVV42_17820 [Candidatus Riflebacteria bacterium HGW-Riflebacteria-2]|jgi:outer membrane protein OmpA-like peptidoglycan-associated protein|nr:MAG: hypothetical protein CVV42_17820 [Candidatus Riflebacteria bacterium HGW-Riflebacteria-2]